MQHTIHSVSNYIQIRGIQAEAFWTGEDKGKNMKNISYILSKFKLHWMKIIYNAIKIASINENEDKANESTNKPNGSENKK